MLGAAVRGAARRFAARAVLVGPWGTLTYGGLDRRADELAAELSAAGLGPGDVVAAVLASDAEWVALAVAADRAEVVLATVSPALAPPERSALVELADPDLVVASADLLDDLSPHRRVG